MGQFSTIFSFALHDILKSRIILILVIISLSMAFSTIFTTSSILEGFEEVLERGAIDWLGHLEITPSDNELSIGNSEAIIKELNKIDNIESVSIRSYITAGVKYKDKFINPYKIMGISLDEEKRVSALSYKTIEGNFINPSEPEKIVLGLGLANALVGLAFDEERIKIGEKVQIITTNGIIKDYMVDGIIDAKTFNPNWMVVLSKKELEKMDSRQKNSEIIIKLKDPTKIQQTKADIENKNFGVRVSTWQQEAGYIDDILDAVSFITTSIKRLVTISALVVISVIIFINVFQKRRQIGIIKSMGASQLFIISIYLFEALMYSVFSYLLGLLVFLIIHRYSIGHPIPLLIGDFHTVFKTNSLLSTFITLGVTIIGASFIPAYLAAKTKIVNVLRGEI